MPSKMPHQNFMGRAEMDYADNMYQHNEEIGQNHFQQHVGRANIEDEQQNERMSPASSTSSTQDLSPHNNPKLKKRSSSTSSGLRTLGRIFGAKKNKNRVDQFNRSNADAYSDSEVSFNAETATLPNQSKPSTNGASNWAAVSNAADFDRKNRKKNELLQEVSLDNKFM
jgi:hypothetical protein